MRHLIKDENVKGHAVRMRYLRLKGKHKGYFDATKKSNESRARSDKVDIEIPGVKDDTVTNADGNVDLVGVDMEGLLEDADGSEDGDFMTNLEGTYSNDFTTQVDRIQEFDPQRAWGSYPLEKNFP